MGNTAAGKRVVRLYTGTDGESHFEDIVIPMEDRGNSGSWSERIKATGMIFRDTDGSHFNDWHAAPRRQFMILLDGDAEIETGDGTKRRLRPGDILLAEDTTGRGHITRDLNSKPRRSIFVTLE